MHSDCFVPGRAVAFVFVCLLTILALGCGGEEGGSSPAVTAQQDTAGQIPMATSRSQTVPSMPGSEAGSGELSWTTPSGWQSVPPANAMRKAQYTVPAAGGDMETSECVVFYFGPGQGGPPGPTPSGGPPSSGPNQAGLPSR